MSGDDIQPDLRQQQALQGVHELLALHLLPQPEQLRRPNLILTFQRQQDGLQPPGLFEKSIPFYA